MEEKSIQAGEVEGCMPTPFYYICHHIQSCGVRSSWEGRYTPPYVYSTPICTLWSVRYLHQSCDFRENIRFIPTPNMITLLVPKYPHARHNPLGNRRYLGSSHQLQILFIHVLHKMPACHLSLKQYKESSDCILTIAVADKSDKGPNSDRRDHRFEFLSKEIWVYMIDLHRFWGVRSARLRGS